MKGSSFLRRVEREDLDVLVEWMQDPDYLRFLYGDAARSPRRIRENIVAMLGRSPQNALPASVHLMIDHQKLGPIGLISLQKISWRNRNCNADVYIGNKSLRASAEAGIATLRMCEYCFDELNLHRITAYIYSFNAPSWRLIERVHGVREMTLKDHVIRDGKLADLYCYGLLRRDFYEYREKETRLRGMKLEEMIRQFHNQPENGGET